MPAFTARRAVFALLLAAALPAAGPAQAGRLKTLYLFQGGSDGSDPVASPLNVAGTLYGMTRLGGATHIFGTVYSLNPTSGAETVVHSFRNKRDGVYPEASLIDVGGTLYGTTTEGDTYGTVFSLNPTTDAETVVYSFKGGSDGAYPEAGLVNVGGTLYGTTAGGDSLADLGTVFALNPATGAETALYAFKGGSDGAEPQASLISVGGTLYGTTQGEGNSTDYGTVFSLNLATGVETVLHAFQGGSDGATPEAGLINVGGTLYGTTVGGEASGDYGTVFSLNPTTGAVAVVYRFQGGSDGEFPYSLIDVSGTLYGTTGAGGSTKCLSNLGCGTVFSLNPASGVETILHSFQGGKDGTFPTGLLNVGGKLYGTTAGEPFRGKCSGSLGQCGTVFEIKP